jgi:hypothetical protein
MGEQALRCEMVASSYVYHSYAGFMFRLHSDPTRGCVHGCVCAACRVTVSSWSELPHQGTIYPTVLQYFSKACGHTVFTKSCTCTASTIYVL